MISFIYWDWVLFTSSLISSTLFPGGSEALLLLKLQAEPQHLYALVIIATLGNVLGSVITYLMGRLGIQLGHRWFRISDKKLQRASLHFERFGAPALLFAWLPIVGDPLCLLAGSLKYTWFKFLCLITLGKLARYSLLAWAFV